MERLIKDERDWIALSVKDRLPSFQGFRSPYELGYGGFSLLLNSQRPSLSGTAYSGLKNRQILGLE